MVYIRYLDMQSFEFVTRFLCCVRVSADDATHHTAVLTGIMESLGLDANKLVGVYTDGARNFTGVKAGVVRQLADLHNPFLVGVHCAAHRTAFVLNDTAKEFSKCLGVVDSLLKGAHGLFAHSHKRQDEWAAFAKHRGVNALKFPLYVKTRWLSRYECLKVLTGNLPVLMEFLDQYNTRRSSGVDTGCAVQEEAQQFKEHQYLFLVFDLIEPLHELSLKLQMDSIMPHEVHMLVNACISK